MSPPNLGFNQSRHQSVAGPSPSNAPNGNNAQQTRTLLSPPKTTSSTLPNLSFSHTVQHRQQKAPFSSPILLHSTTGLGQTIRLGSTATNVSPTKTPPPLPLPSNGPSLSKVTSIQTTTPTTCIPNSSVSNSPRQSLSFNAQTTFAPSSKSIGSGGSGNGSGISSGMTCNVATVAIQSHSSTNGKSTPSSLQNSSSSSLSYKATTSKSFWEQEAKQLQDKQSMARQALQHDCLSKEQMQLKHPSGGYQQSSSSASSSSGSSNVGTASPPKAAQSSNNSITGSSSCNNDNRQHQPLISSLSQHVEKAAAVMTQPIQRKTTIKMKFKPKKSERVTLEIEKPIMRGTSESAPIAIEAIEDEAEQEQEKQQNHEKNNNINNNNNNNTIDTSSNASTVRNIVTDVPNQQTIHQTDTIRNKNDSVLIDNKPTTTSHSPVIKGLNYKASGIADKPTPEPTQPFSWSLYLRHKPSDVAAIEAFTQSPEPLTNTFALDMRLEARDPRNESCWGLARVVGVYGPRIKLRFDGVDASNDFWELVDSENIRPVGSSQEEPLFPPIGYTANLSGYTKFVEKQLAKTNIAPAEAFMTTPIRPASNMFKVGMKLEAIDRKNPSMVCPATIDVVSGDELKIAFDGWSGSFDYRCKYYSRDIFPVGWCVKNNYPISPPKGWKEVLTNLNQPKKYANNASKLLNKSRTTPSPTPASQSKTQKQQPKMHPKATPSTSKTTAPSKNTSNSKLPDHTPLGRPPSKKTKTSLGGKNNKNSFTDNNTTRRSLDKELSKNGKQTRGTPTSHGIEQDEDLSDDEPLPPGTDKFQCQRTVPYTNWQIEKNRSVQTSSKAESATNSDALHISMSTPSGTSSLSSPSYPTDVSEPPTSSTATPKPNDDGHVVKKPKLKLEISARNFSRWTVSNVLELIKNDETLAKYSEVFENHEIDGKAFMLLTTDVMINHMGLKIGPVLKINDLIEKVKRFNR